MAHKILIVDDEEQNLELANIILLKEGYQLFFANNGEEALFCMKQNDINVLVLDLHMPIMDGFETLKEVKKLDKDVKTIIVTANVDKQSHLKALEMGVDDLLMKPYDIVELKKKIRDVLSIKSTSARLYSADELEKITCLLLDKYKKLDKDLNKTKLIELFEKSISSF